MAVDWVHSPFAGSYNPRALALVSALGIVNGVQPMGCEYRLCEFGKNGLATLEILFQIET